MSGSGCRNAAFPASPSQLPADASRASRGEDAEMEAPDCSPLVSGTKNSNLSFLAWCSVSTLQPGRNSTAFADGLPELLWNSFPSPPMFLLFPNSFFSPPSWLQFLILAQTFFQLQVQSHPRSLLPTLPVPNPTSPVTTNPFPCSRLSQSSNSEVISSLS